MSTLLSDLRYSLRLIARHPFFSAVVVLALATGIGVNAGIFSVVNSVLLKPLPYREPDRLYNLWSLSPRTDNPKSSLSVGDFEDIRQASHSFESMTAWYNYAATLIGEDSPMRISTAVVMVSHFPTLGVRPYLGSDFEAKHGVMGSNNVVILSHRFWLRQYGGDPAVVGRHMMLEGEPHLILGVLPDQKGDTSRVDVYAPFAITPEVLATRNARSFSSIVRLKPGVTQQQAEAELRGLAARLAEAYPQTNKGWSFFLVPAAREATGTSRQSLMMLAAAVGMVLLITCANLASLLLVRAAGRTREVAVRSALGARRGRIVRQMLTESVVLALAGGAAGLLLAYGTIRAIKALAPANTPRLEAATLDGGTLLFTFALSVLTGLLFGLAPALQTLRVNQNSILREESRGSSSGVARSRLRSLLVVSEVAMAAMLLASAGLLVRSMLGLSRIDLGYQPDGVLTARTTLADPRFPRKEDRALYAERILERLRNEPGVTQASITLAVPMMQVDWKAEFSVPGSGAASEPLKEVASYNTVSPGYFAALGIPLKEGRGFTPRDNLGSPPVVIVSEAFVRRYFPAASPLGRSLQMKVGREQITAEIVGVAGNAKHLKPDEPPRPVIYQPYAQLPWPFLAFAIRTARDPESMVPAIRRAFNDVDHQQPIDRVMTLQNLLDAATAQQRLAMIMLLAFAGLAVLLASLGLYGLLAYSVAQRTREMGIRAALGASPVDVTLLVSGEGVLLTLAGIAAGLVVTPLASTWFSDMLYGVRPWDPLTFLLTAALLLVIAVLACWAPARRAARLDPAKALQAD